MTAAHAAPDTIDTKEIGIKPNLTGRIVKNGVNPSEERKTGFIKKKPSNTPQVTPLNKEEFDNVNLEDDAEEDFVVLSDTEYDQQIKEEEEMKKNAYLKLSEAGKELQKYLYTAGTNLSKKAYLKLLNAVEELKQYASSEGEKISKNVSSKLSEAGEDLKKYASSEGEKISKNISSKLSEAGSALQAYVSTAGKNLSEKTYSILSNAGETLKEYTSNAASTAEQFLKNSANTASDNFKNLTQGAITGFERLSNDIKNRWYSSQKAEQEQIKIDSTETDSKIGTEKNLSQSIDSPINQESTDRRIKSDIITINKTSTEEPTNKGIFSRMSGWFYT